MQTGHTADNQSFISNDKKRLKINNIMCLHFYYVTWKYALRFHLKPSSFTPNQICGAASPELLWEASLSLLAGAEVGCRLPAAGASSYSDGRGFFLLWLSIALRSASSWMRSDILMSVWLQPILGQQAFFFRLCLDSIMRTMASSS